MLQRARIARWRHPSLGEVSGYCFYATRLQFGDLAFDVGANHGQHAIDMLRRGARVVAIEPQRELAAELARRFPHAEVLPVAVGDAPGEAILHVANNDHVSSLDPTWAEHLPFEVGRGRCEPVQVTTLDALISRYGVPAVVKIDTEGYDHRVLRGLSQPIRHVIFEINQAYPDRAREAFARLTALGRYAFYGAPLTEVGASSWIFREPQEPEGIIASVPLGDVYARQLG